MYKGQIEIITWNVSGIGLMEMELTRLLRENGYVAVMHGDKGELTGTKDVGSYVML